MALRLIGKSSVLLIDEIMRTFATSWTNEIIGIIDGNGRQWCVWLATRPCDYQPWMDVVADYLERGRWLPMRFKLRAPAPWWTPARWWDQRQSNQSLWGRIIHNPSFLSIVFQHRFQVHGPLEEGADWASSLLFLVWLEVEGHPPDGTHPWRISGDGHALDWGR